MYHIFMQSENKVALDLSQPDLDFLVESNSWIVNGKCENCEANAKKC